MRDLYSVSAVNYFLKKYQNAGGNVTELREGVLGHGTLLLHGEGLKTIVITEVYLNEWSSGHKIRKYNNTPKKYLKFI